MNLQFLKPTPTSEKMRIGSNYDGGYVVYKPLVNKTDILITYGVGWDTSFEEHFNTITKARVIMFDPTLFGKYIFDGKYFLKLLSKLRLVETFEYVLFTIHCWITLRKFKRKGMKFVNEGLAKSPQEKYDTFGSHLKRYSVGEKEIMLKIDIECNEYEPLLSDEFYAALQNVNQIVIEFHDLKNRLRDLRTIVDRLLLDYHLIHTHGNNYGSTFRIFDSSTELDLIFPDTVELTFVRRTKIDERHRLTDELEYPEPGLDFPNNSTKADYKLQFDV